MIIDITGACGAFDAVYMGSPDHNNCFQKKLTKNSTLKIE